MCSNRSALLIGMGEGGGLGGLCGSRGKGDNEDGVFLVGEDGGVSSRFADIKIGKELDIGDWKDITRG